ncbi:MAG: Gfo/Idh/MocA family oxidoreductase [Armatimonadetes bacterium]|nr:Gfo/Idh/MocA family oxidoreductase [Armatimonadota bacterium]
MSTSSPSVAVIGCGYWGKNLVRNFSQLSALSAVCESTAVGQAAAGILVPDVRVIPDFAEVLASDVPAVVIATPAETHHDLVLRALRAGKDVFVEKPMALTSEHGSELVREAEALGRILMVGHVLEYHPGIVKLNELVQSGELGKVQYVYSHRLSLGKVRREENALWSFAPHDVAVILRLMGAMPFQVVACGGTYVQPNIADVTVTCLLFDNGVRAHIHVSWLHPFKEQRLVVVGSRKMAVFDDVAKALTLYDQRVEMRNGFPEPVKGAGEQVPYASDEPLRLECRAFLEACRTRTPPLTDGQSGLRALKVLQAAERSLVMNGEPVALPVEAFDGCA